MIPVSVISSNLGVKSSIAYKEHVKADSMDHSKRIFSNIEVGNYTTATTVKFDDNH